jgi:hypothetical protein
MLCRTPLLIALLLAGPTVCFAAPENLIPVIETVTENSQEPRSQSMELDSERSSRTSHSARLNSP